jgi:hypothetical protein
MTVLKSERVTIASVRAHGVGTLLIYAAASVKAIGPDTIRNAKRCVTGRRLYYAAQVNSWMCNERRETSVRVA